VDKDGYGKGGFLHRSTLRIIQRRGKEGAGGDNKPLRKKVEMLETGKSFNPGNLTTSKSLNFKTAECVSQAFIQDFIALAKYALSPQWRRSAIVYQFFIL